VVDIPASPVLIPGSYHLFVKNSQNVSSMAQHTKVIASATKKPAKNTVDWGSIVAWSVGILIVIAVFFGVSKYIDTRKDTSANNINTEAYQVLLNEGAEEEI
jgi:beta-lactamase regulating signal transducer with metallopeptidase domain